MYLLKLLSIPLLLTTSLLLNNTENSDASNEEYELRKMLFDNYEKESRPIYNINKPVVVDMGLAIQTLEQFNQKTETIKLNIWFRMNWMNQYMNWYNNSNYTISSIDVNPTDIWIPDIELINAASLPEIYTLKGGMMLYNTGECMWSRPGIFMFSCPLDLHNFPFDIQTCNMTFASWIFSNKYLLLKPYDNEAKAVDILNDFSHSEWNIKSIDYSQFNIQMENNEEKTAIKYTIKLERFTHYYTLTMGMTITLVYVSFLIMFLPPDNISRTSTAVFIPLTILALQLTIIDKVPVVGYYTLMDKFFLCCFICSMMVSMLSAIIFSLISHKSHKVLQLVAWFKDINSLKEDVIPDLDIGNNIVDNGDEQGINEIRMFNIKKEDIDIGDIYENPLRKRTHSYSNALKSENNIELQSNLQKKETNIIKTINHNNKLLDLTNDELLLYNYMTTKIKLLDNILRVLLPLVYTIYIGVLLKH